jgi:hypothetical protein
VSGPAGGEGSTKLVLVVVLAAIVSAPLVIYTR